MNLSFRQENYERLMENSESEKLKVISLKQYKRHVLLKKEVKKLEKLGKEEYHLMSEVEQKGFRNYLKLIKMVSSPEPGPERDD